LERFLDTTKANLFFANGVIMVEGWSEEILIPAIAQRLYEQGTISKNLTQAGVSIVNVGNTAFQQYSRIYLRADDSKQINIPVSVITDVDVRAYKLHIDKDEDGAIIKTYIKEDEVEVQEKSEKKKTEIVKKYNDQNVKTFVAENWTLEYALLKSTSLSKLFSDAFKKVHPQINLDIVEEELGKKLISKLYKTQIAYEIAANIELNSVLPINEDDASIKYIIDAIKHACND